MTEVVAIGRRELLRELDGAIHLGGGEKSTVSEVSEHCGRLL